jgi:hypothetical protein
MIELTYLHDHLMKLMLDLQEIMMLEGVSFLSSLLSLPPDTLKAIKKRVWTLTHASLPISPAPISHLHYLAGISTIKVLEEGAWMMMHMAGPMWTIIWSICFAEYSRIQKETSITPTNLTKPPPIFHISILEEVQWIGQHWDL